MRVAQLAELTDTTVRTIRHYHAIGLLPVPRERHGWRDYDLSHVARLSRIRWLIGAGLTLQTITELLAGPAEPPRTELHAALRALDDQLHSLTDQRARLAALINAVDNTAELALTPMPPSVARFYATLIDRAPDERTARAIRRERDFTELAYYRGEIPPEAAFLYVDPSDADIAESLAAFGAQDGIPDEEAVGALADAVVARMLSRLGDRAAELARSVDLALVNRVYDLYAVTAAPEDLRIAEAVRDTLIRTIEELRR